MNCTDILNNKDTPVEDRIKTALKWLEGHPDPEGVPSAKCFLTYRAIEGMIPMEEYRKVVEPVTYGDHPNPGLTVRWHMSIGTAQTYLHTLNHEWDRVHETSTSLHHSAVQEGWLNLWPPTVLNFLRMTVVSSYYHHLLTLDNTAISQIVTAIKHWKRQVARLDWVKFPMRFVEMGHDLCALTTMVFIAKAAGHTNFPRYEWMNESKNLEKTQEPLRQVLLILGKVNPDRALWR